VVGGPIASGKSSLAVAAALALERRGLAAATIDLDLVYEMLDRAPGLKSKPAVWSRARRIAGALAAAFFADGLDVVIAEGDFLDEGERGEFTSALDAGVSVRFVTLTVSLPTALRRVEQDSTRGISRDPGFLARHYEELSELLRSRPEHDLCLDTGDMTVEEAAESIAEWSLRSAAA
jgi:chloramphenicol 3-O-phosphotransferase